MQRNPANSFGTDFSSKGATTAMPRAVQQKMENSFGTDLSNVAIIHKDSGSATDMGALAYAQGNEVHFAPGQYNPETRKGQELLGHELTHVVQQRQGRVQATTQGKGMAINDDPALEREADVMGAKAAQGENIENFKSIYSLSGDKTIQNKCDKCKKEENAQLKNASGFPIQMSFGNIALPTIGITGVPWSLFWRQVINRFALRGATAAGLVVIDGPLPIGDLIALGLSIWTIYEIIRLWDVLWENAEEKHIMCRNKYVDCTTFTPYSDCCELFTLL